MGEATTPLEELLPWLNRIDTLIHKALLLAESLYSPDTTAPYRGLQISLEEVELLLQRHPAEPLFATCAPETASPPAASRLAWLQRQFQLTPIDLDILALALAPELDRRYERLYAYLQDDVRAKHPTVDLALNLLFPTAIDRLQQRDRFSPDAPLIHHHLLHLVSDPNQPNSTLLAKSLKLDDQIVRFLLGNKGLDIRLAPFCKFVAPTLSLNDLYLSAELKQGFSGLIQQYQQTHQPLRLYFQGSDRHSKRRTAEALAREMAAPLLIADLRRLGTSIVDFEPNLQLLWREAQFHNALLYLDNLEVLHSPEQAIAFQYLLSTLADYKGSAILAGVPPWIPASTEALGIVKVRFTIPDVTQRLECWQNYLNYTCISLEDSDLKALAERFRLTSDQIADAVATAVNTVHWQSELKTKHENPKLADLFAAARAQSGHHLTELARKIEPKHSLNDIILPEDQKNQLREICNQAKYRSTVLEDWGFDCHLSLGKGLNVLFSGLPGTGKTMAAEAIACELELDLYKIDLSQIVSKYIGETEKNLDRIFTAAASSNAILLFDEADALFGKRSEVKDARDRYANIEVGYLLQKMEEYEGIAILTTNLGNNMDDAFVRRLRFIIEFPFPKEKERRQIWEKIWPATTPRSQDLDLDFMARRIELAGGSIRNIALAAAFLASDDGGIVSMSHLIRATRREYQKMGKVLMDEEFGNYSGL